MNVEKDHINVTSIDLNYQKKIKIIRVIFLFAGMGSNGVTVTKLLSYS